MKLIATSFFLCFISFQLAAQEYVPMLANTNEWHLSTCYQGVCLKDIYYTDGDTIVDNMSYKILDGYHYISRGFLLREDVQEQKVYMKIFFNGSNRDYLLYDFSLEEGDIFEMSNPITPFPQEGGPFILEEKSLQTLANGQEVMHYYFSPSPENTTSIQDAIWIQGMGSLSIPNAPGGHPDFDGAGQVSCAFRDGEVYYTDFTILTECEQTVLSNNTSQLLSSVNHYATETHLFIENLGAHWDYRVYDLSGREIQPLLERDTLYVSIDKSNLKNGVYLIALRNHLGQNYFIKVSI